MGEAACRTLVGIARGRGLLSLVWWLGQRLIESRFGIFIAISRPSPYELALLGGVAAITSFVVRRRFFTGWAFAVLPLAGVGLTGLRRLGPRGADQGFHSAVLDLASGRSASDVIESIEEMGLEVRDRGARRTAYLTSLLLAAVAGMGVAIDAIGDATQSRPEIPARPGATVSELRPDRPATGNSSRVYDSIVDLAPNPDNPTPMVRLSSG